MANSPRPGGRAALGFLLIAASGFAGGIIGVAFLDLSWMGGMGLGNGFVFALLALIPAGTVTILSLRSGWRFEVFTTVVTITSIATALLSSWASYHLGVALAGV